jgi:protein-S-isoprenylcysteine O-methyltransferase Ste14
MWFVRFALLILLSVMVAVLGYLMRNRGKLIALFENRAANLALVFTYCLACFLMAGLPSDPNVFPAPSFFTDEPVRIGYLVIGSILIGIYLLIGIVAVRQRKALGGQDVKAGLLTTGLYKYFRHPIYAAIIWGCLGAALVLGTWDGLLMIPFVFLLNAAEAFLEEHFDVGVRFADQYSEYRKKTRMFGPIWLWASLAAVLVAVPLVFSLVA